MKKSFRKLLIGYIVVFTLTVLAGISATYAWVSSKRAAESRGARLTIKEVSDITNISCYVLKYDGVEKASYTLIEPNNSYQITMSEFDMVFRDKNINTPLIIRLVVTDLPSDVSTNTTGHFTINVPCSSAYLNDSGHIIGSLSNVIAIKCGCGLLVNGSNVVDSYGATIENNEKVAIFTGAKSAVETNPASTGRYVVGSVEDRVKRDIITLTLSHSVYQNHIQNIEYNGQTKPAIILNIEFNYVDELVEEYVNSYGGYSPSNDFTADIGTIYVEWEKGEE